MLAILLLYFQKPKSGVMDIIALRLFISIYFHLIFQRMYVDAGKNGIVEWLRSDSFAVFTVRKVDYSLYKHIWSLGIVSTTKVKLWLQFFSTVS